MVALHDLRSDFLFSCQMICKQHIVLNQVFFRYESNLEPVTLKIKLILKYVIIWLLYNCDIRSTGLQLDHFHLKISTSFVFFHSRVAFTSFFWGWTSGLLMDNLNNIKSTLNANEQTVSVYVFYNEQLDSVVQLRLL